MSALFVFRCPHGKMLNFLHQCEMCAKDNLAERAEFIRTQQAEIERVTEQRDRLLAQLNESQRELINWDDSLRISAELLGDSKPTRLPIQKIINMNKALIAEIEAKNE